METFFWLIAGFSIVLVIKCLYDKYLLEDSLKSSGGIKKKYKILIRYLSNAPNAKVTEFKDHLTVSVKTTTIHTEFSVTPAFGTLIVEVVVKVGAFRKIENIWKFDEFKYSQDAMVKAINTYMESEFERLTPSISRSNSSSTPYKADVKTKISEIKFLSITERIELAILLYNTILPNSMLKARVLSIWYQPAHNNTFSDFITKVFQDIKIKERMLTIPIAKNQETNYKIILKSVKKAEGYEKIEEFFFRFIRLVKEKHEIDRLLFLILAISPDYKDEDNLWCPVIELAFTDLKLEEDMEEYSRYHIFKTLLDLYFYNGYYQAALNIAEENYNVLNTTEYNLPWLKYQYASALCRLHNEGYQSRWNESFLLKQIEEQLSEAVLQDYNFEVYMKQAK